MGGPYCGGIVTTLRNQLVLFTGKTYVRGEHQTKVDLRLQVRARGGRNAPDRSTAVTLLVLGDLSGQHVVDPVNLRSQKAVFVDKQREYGNHICVVDSVGFSALLDGRSAQCLETRLVKPGTIEVTRPTAPASPEILGGAITFSAAPVHDPTGLELDLDGLDRATAAHIALAKTLTAHLASRGVEVSTPAAGMPLFDAGWSGQSADSTVYIAELKSLTGANETQQIRLGVGQVLDYVSSIRALRTDTTIAPVLVLQREPQDERWQRLAESVGLILSWAPDFPRI